MTDADFKKAFNIFEASPEDFEAAFGVKPTPSQLAKYNEHLQNLSRQSVAITNYLVESKMQSLRGQITPIQSTIAAQREESLKNDFFKEYPGLTGYEPALREIIDAARFRGQTFNGNVAAMKQFVAAQAARLLGRPVESFRTAAAQAQVTTQTTQPQSGARTMSTTSMGGRTGAAGGAAPTKSTTERIFADA